MRDVTQHRLEDAQNTLRVPKAHGIDEELIVGETNWQFDEVGLKMRMFRSGLEPAIAGLGMPENGRLKLVLSLESEASAAGIENEATFPQNRQGCSVRTQIRRSEPGGSQ